MTTAASIGYGSLLEISTDGGSNWDEIAEVFSITPPSSSVDIVDVTHMQSPGRDREFILGLNDPGEASMELNFVPGSDTDALLLEIKGAYAPVKCRITWPNAVAWTFDGLLTGYEPSAPNDDKMTATVTFKVTGSVVSTAAAAPVNSVKPAISGVLAVAEVLTAFEGVWSGAPTFAYQWKNAGVNIGGATSKTYTVVGGDAGDSITVTVTATNSEGSASATSAPVVIAS